MRRRIFGAAGFNRKNRKLAKAMTASIESLERRQMLSIAASTLRGPLAAGDTWTYAETDSDNQSSGITEVDTSKGKTEFQGNDATEIDTVITNNSNADTDTDQQYFGFDSTGDYVEYGDVDTSIIGNDTDVDTTTDTPTAVVFPSPLTGGVTAGPINYTKNDRDVFNGGEPSTGSTDVSISFELDSEATSPLITPAGTFEVYDVTINETDTDNEADPPTVTSSTTNVYVDPKVGEIEIANTNGAELVLQSYSLTNGGGGGGGGDTGGTGGVLTPTITKDTVPAAVVGGATLHGADLTVDVTNSGDGADKGFILNVYASTDTTLDTSTDQVVTRVTKTTLVG